MDPRISLVLLGCAVLVAGCPHDFTREARDLAVGDTGADGSLSSDTSRPRDILRLPDVGCPLPCVETMPILFKGPVDVAVDESAGKLYVAESSANRIRVVDLGTQVVEPFAGSGLTGNDDGDAKEARFHSPSALALAGSKIYVADEYNHRIRAIDISSETVATLAGDGTNGFLDGPALAARFNHPFGIAFEGGKAYVADEYVHRIRVIDIGKGTVATLAGSVAGFEDSALLSAKFYYPAGLAMGSAGEIYVADQQNHRIRVIEGGQVTTLAGDGTVGFVDAPALSARFYSPSGVAVDGAGRVYVADANNNAIRVVQGGTVSTLAGNGTLGLKNGPAHKAWFYYPSGVDVDSTGTVYVADTYNNRVRVIRQ